MRALSCAALVLSLVVAAPSAWVDAAGAEVDGARSWPAPNAHRSLLTGGAIAGERLVAVGERGHILIGALDSGPDRQVSAPANRLLTAVDFADDLHGIAVGHDGIILRTATAGESWQRVAVDLRGDDPLLSVWMETPSTGLAVGAYGLALVTDDGGASWRRIEIEADADFHLNHVAASADGRLYIAAEAGRIYRSDDGGEHWQVLPFPYTGSLFGVLPMEGSTVLAFGLRGHLYRSIDAGMHWQRIATDTHAALTCAVRLADGRILVAGHEGARLISLDGGRSFMPVHAEATRRSVSAMVAGGGEVWLLGEQGAQRWPDLSAPAH